MGINTGRDVIYWIPFHGDNVDFIRLFYHAKILPFEKSSRHSVKISRGFCLRNRAFEGLLYGMVSRRCLGDEVEYLTFQEKRVLNGVL